MEDIQYYVPRRWASAQHDEAVSSYQIKAMIGEPTAELLGTKVAIYKPQVHYSAVKYKWIGTTLPPE
jgi:outer membrane protein